MAFKTHHRLTFGGVLGEVTPATPDEIWACNVNVTGINGEDFDEEAYLDAIVGPLATWFASPKAHMSQGASLTYVKCNKVGADGKYVSSGDTHRRDITPNKAGAFLPIDPDIISIALSWSTAVARGPGAHGRIYLPNATVGFAGRMVIYPDDQLSLAQGGAALLKIINNSGGAGPTLFPVIASRVNATNTTITGVRVGSVKDVQRRRKNAIHETYVAVKVDPGTFEIIQN